MVVCGPHSPSITAHGLSMSFCLLLFVGAKEDNAHCSNYHTSSSSAPPQPSFDYVTSETIWFGYLLCLPMSVAPKTNVSAAHNCSL